MSDHTKLRHVHVGTGAFGLGFAAPLGASAGLLLSLVNRRRGDAGTVTFVKNDLLKTNCSFDLESNDGAVQSIQCAEVLFLDEHTNLFAERVADPNTLLLTTAVRA